MNPVIEGLHNATVLAENIWPYAWPLAVACLSFGLFSPLLSPKQKDKVIWKDNALRIDIERNIRRKESTLVNRAKLVVMNLTRGSSIYAGIFYGRFRRKQTVK